MPKGISAGVTAGLLAYIDQTGDRETVDNFIKFVRSGNPYGMNTGQVSTGMRLLRSEFKELRTLELAVTAYKAMLCGDDVKTIRVDVVTKNDFVLFCKSVIVNGKVNV